MMACRGCAQRREAMLAAMRKTTRRFLTIDEQKILHSALRRSAKIVQRSGKQR
jgi:hypothetical protein